MCVKFHFEKQQHTAALALGHSEALKAREQPTSAILYNNNSLLLSCEPTAVMG